MFTNKKIKTVVASVCVTATLILNTVSAIAAPFSYNGAEDVRAKALGEYLSSTTGVVSMTKFALNAENEVSSLGNEVFYEEITVDETVNFNTVKKLNTALLAGETVTVREGVSGQKKVTYKVKYENGVEISREMISEVITVAPVDKIVEYGTTAEVQEASAEAMKLDYKSVITCEATAYDLSPEENGGYAGQTATGVPLDKGVIAVDPRIIPLGSRVYIEALDGSWSYGYAVAADTGGAIKGYRVDLCYRTKSECRQFGRRPCRVYILN
ncbi:MAG: G5 domain-containing protein [Clostridia bacterium]|nr:G5 domain-containing protein [Clostridia bacterium]